MRNLPATLLGTCLLLTGAAASAQFGGNANNIQYGNTIKQVLVSDDMPEAKSYWHPTATFSAFVVQVPPQGKIEAALNHHDMGSMFMACYTQAQFNNMQRGNAEIRRSITRKVKFENSGKDPVKVYFLVSDIEQRSTKTDPYTVLFTRSWGKPAEAPASTPAAEPKAPTN